MLRVRPALGGPLVVALVLVTAGCLGVPGQSTDTPAATAPPTTRSTVNATNDSVHYFHHPASPTDERSTRAIDVALRNESVAATVSDTRRSVVGVWMVGRAKYRECSPGHDCAAVRINYDWGALEVSVDLETNEVWSITRLPAPRPPAARVSPDGAERIALEHVRQRRSGELAASTVGTISRPEAEICEYHGCLAVIVRGEGNYTALVTVDAIEREVVHVETIREEA